jgi:hypothetical protein
VPTITRLDRPNLRWSPESAQGKGHPAKTKRRLKANLRAAERQENSILILQLVASWPPPTKVNPAPAAPYTPATRSAPATPSVPRLRSPTLGRLGVILEVQCTAAAPGANDKAGFDDVQAHSPVPSVRQHR